MRVKMTRGNPAIYFLKALDQARSLPQQWFLQMRTNHKK